MSSDSPFSPPNSNPDQISHKAELVLDNPSSPRKNSIWFWGSWLLITAVVACITSIVFYSQFFVPRSFETSAAELMQINMSAKVAVGMSQPANTSLQSVEQFKQGPLEQRYCQAILVNEFKGAEPAVKQLEAIDKAVASELAAQAGETLENEFPTESQKEIRRVIGDLFGKYESGEFDTSTFPPSDKNVLSKQLGWVGELALTTSESPDSATRESLEEEASRTFMVVILAMVFGLFTILAALVAVAMLFGLFVAQQMQIHFQNYVGRGFVYAETFAIWILFFFGLQIGLGYVGNLIDNNLIAMALTPVAFFGSLAVLAWPVARGIPFATMCRDIGWEIRNPFVEVFIGGFSYLALIIPMLLGISITVLIGVGLSFIDSPGAFESAGAAGHPIAEELASGDPIVWIFVILSACVAAPIVEETMFRGVLYRSLRDSTSRHSKWISVALSALFNGLIFASIHPQGIVGVPVLTTLAIGFSLVREWRGSLIGPMVMHAINNSIVTCMLLVLMS